MSLYKPMPCRHRSGASRFGIDGAFALLMLLLLQALCNAVPVHAQTRSEPSAAIQSPARRPNVLVIVADDLAWPDVSAYGRNAVHTPNIDRIARRGAAFSNGYVAASVCALSRAALLTGRMPQRIGFHYNIDDGDADPEQGLPLTETTLADRLKGNGYRTAAIGKWHLGFAPQFYPTRRGFDEFYGFLGGEAQYADPGTPGIVTTPSKRDKAFKRNPAAAIVMGPDATPVGNQRRYLTEDLTDRAVDYIDRNASGNAPFFLYLAYNAPHWPFQVPQRYYDRFAGIEDPIRRTQVAMISALDDGVGRVLDALERTGTRDDTLVIFVSDNGCPLQLGACDCSHPLGAGKFTYVEGGIRVPFLISWPHGMPAMGLVDTPVSSLDVVPTVLTAAGIDLSSAEPLEGLNLIAAAQGRTSEQQRVLIWGQNPVFATREGKWKLWQSIESNRVELYDLEADSAELKDISKDHAEIAQHLVSKITAWRATLPPPLWPRRFAKQLPSCKKETTWVY